MRRTSWRIGDSSFKFVLVCGRSGRWKNPPVEGRMPPTRPERCADQSFRPRASLTRQTRTVAALCLRPAGALCRSKLSPSGFSHPADSDVRGYGGQAALRCFLFLPLGVSLKAPGLQPDSESR